jgi:predicted RNase H-like nuclease (RuvC/YqgF family)
VKLLAIDPGILTGLAFFDEEGNLSESRTIHFEEFDLLDQYRQMAEDGLLTVVIEDTPTPTQSKMNRSLFAILSELRTFFPDAVYVKPSWWKAHPAHKMHIGFGYLGKDATQHQRDALKLGLWFMISHKWRVG